MLHRLTTFVARPTATRTLFNTAFKSISSSQPTMTIAALSKSALLRSSSCQFKQLHSSSINYFASSLDWDTNKPSNVHPMIEKIQRHPHIMAQLVDFTNLLQSKGVDVSGKKPSFMQVMKVMNDPEIKEKVQKLAQDMQTAGIQLDMQTIQELQSSFADLQQNAADIEEIFDEKKSLEESTQDEEKQRGRKRGLFSKMFNKK